MRYVILLVLALTAGFLGFFLRDRGYWFVDNLAGNLAAGFLGSLAVLFFIERSIENKRQEERTRLATLAFRQIQLSLQRIVDLFADMLKASSSKPLISLPASLPELFSPVSVADLDWLDLNGPTGSGEHTDWKAQCEAVLNTELERLAAIMDRYLPFLEIELVEAIDSITADPFVNYVRGMRRVAVVLDKQGAKSGPTLYGTSVIRDEFFTRLLAAAKQLNLSGGKALVVPTSLVRQDMMPNAGQARFKLLPATPVLVGAGDPPVVEPGVRGDLTRQV